MDGFNTDRTERGPSLVSVALGRGDAKIENKRAAETSLDKYDGSLFDVVAFQHWEN